VKQTDKGISDRKRICNYAGVTDYSTPNNHSTVKSSKDHIESIIYAGSCTEKVIIRLKMTTNNRNMNSFESEEKLVTAIIYNCLKV